MLKLSELDAQITDITAGNVLDVVKAPMRDWKGVVIHHSYAPEKPVWGKNYGRIFNAFHFEACGWLNGLGWQFLLSHNTSDPSEIRIQCGHRWIAQAVGAHCLNRKKAQTDNVNPNETLIGICVVGNYDIHLLDPMAYLALKEFIDALMAKLNIPRHAIFGAYQFDYVTSPGKRFDLQFLRR